MKSARSCLARFRESEPPGATPRVPVSAAARTELRPPRITKRRLDQKQGMRVVGWALTIGMTIGVDRAAADDIVSLVTHTTVKQAIGRQVRGQVESESSSEVVVQLGATTIKVPADQVVSIRYDKQSASFLVAESREAAGLLSEAAELFRTAAADPVAEPLAVRAAQFREAEVLADLALVEPERMKEAKDKLAKFIRQNPSSRQIAPAQECVARLQLNGGDFPAAAATIAALAKIPNFGDRAAVLRTKLLAKQGKNAEAIAELDRLIAAYPKVSEQRRSAILAKAENLAVLKKYKEAEALVREAITATPAEDAMAQAAAYNTLGDCFRAANRPKDALIAFLHTDLLYAKNKEEHPRALYQIQSLFRQLKQDGRADEFAQRLKQEYPRSPWLKNKESE
jgi:TolA-binding protein